MKTILAVIAAVLLSTTVYGQGLEHKLNNVGFGLTPSVTFVIKNWSGSWSPIDTTSWFDLTSIDPSDTLLVAYVSTPSTTGYNLAVKAQFANNAAVKPAVTLDSLVRVGPERAAAAAGETTKDSIYYGRSIYFDWTHKFAGATKVRLILAKDTAQASDTDLGTNSGTATMNAGFLRETK